MSTEKFINQISVQCMISLYDSFPETLFWIKDLQGRYICINETCRRHYNLRSCSEAVGRTDYDFRPKFFAELYIQDDKKVIETGEPLTRREPVLRRDNTVCWFEAKKKPLYSQYGELIGTFGIASEVTELHQDFSGSIRFNEVTSYILKNICQKIQVSDLASIMCLSVSAFERSFKKYFNMTPSEYIKTMRINLACEELLKTDKSISEIAVDCGFYDHSFMSKVFRAVLSLSPTEFRSRR
jgi:AraC-like DNA-binding protein